MTVVHSLLPSIDSILGIRDQIGAGLKSVKIMTRTWSGEEPGDGEATEVLTDILPTPLIVEFGADVRIKEGGAVKEGDILLKGISKHAFPTEADINCETENRNIEKFYEVGGLLYQVMHVKENHVTWDVHLRLVSDQRRYP